MMCLLAQFRELSRIMERIMAAVRQKGMNHVLETLGRTIRISIRTIWVAEAVSSFQKLL